jgi:hypothetical protein
MPWPSPREPTCLPCTPEPVTFLQKNGVLCAPGKASNAGGVEEEEEAWAPGTNSNRFISRNLLEFLLRFPLLSPFSSSPSFSVQARY